MSLASHLKVSSPTRVVPVGDIRAELPSDTAIITAEERASILAIRRRAVRERFGR